MNLQKLQTLRHSFWRRIRQRPKLSSAVGVALISPFFFLFTGSRPPIQPLDFYEARHGDFLISVVEGGNLEAVNEVSIRSEVEGTARIIYISRKAATSKKTTSSCN